MKKRIFAVLLTVAMVATLLAGCGGSGAEDKEVIKLGVRDSADQYEVVKSAIEEAGYTVEVTVFDDSIQPNVALGEGSIDINWYQHEPYLDAYNAENGTDFVMVQPKTAAPLFGMYSEKITKVDELPDGATIGICADASNQARGMFMLQDQGLITLKEGVEVPTQYDIVDNPKNLKFVEADMQVLPQSLPDVDACCMAAAHMVNAGLDGTKYVCCSSDAEEYAVGFVVRAEDADADWAKGLAEAVQTDALAEYFATEKQGVMVPMWK